MTLAGLVVAATVTVAAPAGALGVSTCPTATGYVFDIYGNALAGATVAASDPQGSCGSGATATTAANGVYSVEIPATSPTDSATASLPNFTSATETIAVLPSLSPTANDFHLLYNLPASLSPTAVQAGKPITISAATHAPPPGQASGYACAWGGNTDGEFGDGTYIGADVPVPVAGIGGTGYLSGVTAIAAGYGYTLALLADGTVAASGFNGGGELGNGTTTDSTTPVQVQGVGGTGTLSGVTAISAGGGQSLALLANGTVVSWGGSASTTPVPVQGVGGTGTLSGVTAISAGADGHSLALLANGTVVAWGDNYYGALGNGTTTNSTTPVPVEGVGGTGTLSGVSAIAAGDGHSLALLANGTVVAWGYNDYGQLGDGTTTARTTPVQVEGVGGTGTLSKVVAIAAGDGHSLALLANGTVVAWGYNDYGQLGDGTTTARTTPVQVEGVGGTGTLSKVVAIAGGFDHSLAGLSNGTALAWGDGRLGQLGNGTTTTSTTPVAVMENGGSDALSGLAALAGGDGDSFAARSSPCTAITSATRVIAELLPSGSTFALTHGATDSQGVTTWSGTYTPPTGTPDGTYSLELCAVDLVFKGNCDQAAQAGPPAIATPIVPLSYLVDDTPPVMTSTSPAGFTDVTAAPSVSVTWSDGSGSGVNPASMTMSIDGTPVPVTVSGSTETASGSGLAPGVHEVQAQAADNAGNVGSTSFPFTLASLTAGAATASKSTATPIYSNPPATQGGTVPGPSSVTFSGVQVQVGGFAESLNASSWVGYGAVGRSVTFGPLQVTFTDSTGAVSDQSQPFTITATIPHQLATVAPSASGFQAQIPPTTFTLPNFTVPVPTSFPNAPGSTATLPPLSASLGPSEPLDDSGAPSAVLMHHRYQSGSSVIVTGDVSVCLAKTTNPPPGGASGWCAMDSSPTAKVFQNGEPLAQLLQPVGGPPDPSTNKSDAPTCTQTTTSGGITTTSPACTGPSGSTDSSVAKAFAAVSLGCGPYTVSAQGTSESANLCTGQDQPLPSTGVYGQFTGAFVNAWLFEDPSGGYHLWRQDHVDPGADSCPDGRPSTPSSPGVTADVYRAAADTVALDSASGARIAGAFKKNSDNGGPLLQGGMGPIELGSATQADPQSDESSGAHSTSYPSDAYRISSPELTTTGLDKGLGYYSVLAGDTMDALGTLTASASATVNAWQADPANALASQSTAQLDGATSLQLTTGTDFATPGSSGGYVFSAHLPFQVVVTYGCS